VVTGCGLGRHAHQVLRHRLKAMPGIVRRCRRSRLYRRREGPFTARHWRRRTPAVRPFAPATVIKYLVFMVRRTGPLLLRRPSVILFFGSSPFMMRQV